MQERGAGDPERIGPYRVLGRLGSGGMGRVFLGRSVSGRMLAIKVIRAELAEDPEFRARFGREVEAARRVSGVFTAPVVDADVDAPMPWLATAYVAGPSLAEAISSNGPFPAASVLALAAGLAEALSAIHAAGLVHRDLKPSNVLLAADGPRVIDFGISRAAEISAMTGTGLIVGSPGFMSPEQAEGREVGPPSDVFSLGALLTFAGTGQGPFGTGSAAALLYRVVHNLPSTEGLPEQVKLIAKRCMHKDPEQRPTPAQLLTELEAAAPVEGWLPQPITEQLHPQQALGPGRTVTGNIAAEPATVTAVSAPRGNGPQPLAPAANPVPVEDAGRARRRKRPRRTMAAVIILPVLAAIAVAVTLMLSGKPAGSHQLAASSGGHPSSPAAGSRCLSGVPNTAVVGSVCLTVPQEYYQSARDTDFLIAYRDGSSCPNGGFCGEFYVLTGDAYDIAFAGGNLGDPDQQLGIAFSKSSGNFVPTTAGGDSCSNHEVVSPNTEPFGPKTAEYRQWTVSCPNSQEYEVQAWKIPTSRIIVVAEQLSALDSTSVQTMVAQASFISTTSSVLSAPTQLAPQDGSVFSNFPRTMKLSWQPATGTTRYVVQIQACNPNGCAASTTSSGTNSNLPPYTTTVKNTSFPWSFVGAQPGRWRVAALKPDGELGQFSPWWGFTFTR
jgi:hypothetical protein